MIPGADHRDMENLKLNKPGTKPPGLVLSRLINRRTSLQLKLFKLYFK
jgi:hypothetical protein